MVEGRNQLLQVPWSPHVCSGTQTHIYTQYISKCDKEKTEEEIFILDYSSRCLKYNKLAPSVEAVAMKNVMTRDRDKAKRLTSWQPTSKETYGPDELLSYGATGHHPVKVLPPPSSTIGYWQSFHHMTFKEPLSSKT